MSCVVVGLRMGTASAAANSTKLPALPCPSLAGQQSLLKHTLEKSQTNATTDVIMHRSRQSI